MIMATASSLSSFSLTFHLFIILSSFSFACVAGFLYAHPLLLPFCTTSFLRLHSAVSTHLTPPILFGLLNLLLVALYASSSIMPVQGKRIEEFIDTDEDLASNLAVIGECLPHKRPPSAGDGPLITIEDEDKGYASISSPDDDDYGNANKIPTEGASRSVCTILSDNGKAKNDCDATLSTHDDAIHSNDATSTIDTPVDKVFPHSNSTPAAVDIRKCHNRPEMQSRKNTKNRNQRLLARSKSDGIVLQLSASRKTPSELRLIVPSLKKAGTFDTTWRRRHVKPVVVVADPPEDGHVKEEEEEVDKKAEDFIGRFYQRMRLQR